MEIINKIDIGVVAIICISVTVMFMIQVDRTEDFQLIDGYSEWRYFDKDMWPGDDWSGIDFEDSSWKTGRPYIATSDASKGVGVNTVLDGGNPAYLTYYFRHNFTLEDKSLYKDLSFRIDYDDQYIVYLNGVVIGSSNPECDWKNHKTICPPKHHSLITNNPSFPLFPTNYIEERPPYLLERDNTIAVAIKQAEENSSDAAFMFELASVKTIPKTLTLRDIVIIYSVCLIMLVLKIFLYRSVKYLNGFLNSMDNTKDKKPMKDHTKQATTVISGHSYAIYEDKGVNAIEMFLTAVKNTGRQGMYISRHKPDILKNKYDLNNIKLYWLTGVYGDEDDVIPPRPLEISITFNKFTEMHKESIVLLEGIEYLINEYDFNIVLKLISTLVDNAAKANAILLIPLVSQSLSKKERALLDSELEVI